MTHSHTLSHPQDFVKVKKGTLIPELLKFSRNCMSHVTTTCEICQGILRLLALSVACAHPLGRGFYCDLCKSEELLFSFHSHTCSCSVRLLFVHAQTHTHTCLTCQVCGALFHGQCALDAHINESEFVTAKDGNKNCPTCQVPT